MNYSQNDSAKNYRMFFLGNILVSTGILIVTTGGSWDISNHLLNRPETFFAPPHAVLYSGVAVALFGATLVMLKMSVKEIKSENQLSIKLILVGIALLLGAGPFDFLWHSSFGLDGLLSPPHLALICGMVFSSIGSFISIAKNSAVFVRNSYMSKNILTVLSIIPVWLSVTGLFFSFSLPFSQTDYFDFNPDPVFGAIFATIAFPFLISLMLYMAYLVNDGKFGFISTTGATLVVINMMTSIIPNPWLHPTVPFYLFTIIPIVLCDLVLMISKNKMRTYLAAGIFGMLGYFVYYPLITHVYNKIDTNQIVSASVTSKIYFDMVLSVYPLIVVPCIVMGLVGALVCHRMINSIMRHEISSQLS
ncbi:hypothetical protein [Candidatus Nitrosotenuis sp. DW1]|uniref:hypothetical protein n=1 Tax=Candidatus Nitrosotenuis sp. DW1 TaxID=2259672 RepID=UPI0015CBDEF6|nr:hypothetical protein [Candidatus Nitrosotenuis sp. DW1]QLH08792.1 hypothetical protein DSQ19_04220 [Candidatus Nitrosotenuis sp. DW1]